MVSLFWSYLCESPHWEERKHPLCWEPPHGHLPEGSWEHLGGPEGGYPPRCIRIPEHGNYMPAAWPAFSDWHLEEQYSELKKKKKETLFVCAFKFETYNRAGAQPLWAVIPEWISPSCARLLAIAQMTVVMLGAFSRWTPRAVRREDDSDDCSAGWRYDRFRCLHSSSPPITSWNSGSWHTATCEGSLNSTLPSATPEIFFFSKQFFCNPVQNKKN